MHSAYTQHLVKQVSLGRVQARNTIEDLTAYGSELPTRKSSIVLRNLKTAYMIKYILILFKRTRRDRKTSKVTKVTEERTKSKHKEKPDASYASGVDGQAKKSAGWMPWH